MLTEYIGPWRTHACNIVNFFLLHYSPYYFFLQKWRKYYIFLTVLTIKQERYYTKVCLKQNQEMFFSLS